MAAQLRSLTPHRTGRRNRRKLPTQPLSRYCGLWNSIRTTRSLLSQLAGRARRSGATAMRNTTRREVVVTEMRREAEKIVGICDGGFQMFVAGTLKEDFVRRVQDLQRYEQE